MCNYTLIDSLVNP